MLDFELELAAWIGPGNAAGQPIGVIDMWLDLTDRKHQERRLLQSDATARSMFDNSPVASMMSNSAAR